MSSPTHVQSPTPVLTSSGTSHQITVPSVAAGALLVLHIGYSDETVTATIADDKGNTWALSLGPIDSAFGTSRACASRIANFRAQSRVGPTLRGA